MITRVAGGGDFKGALKLLRLLLTFIPDPEKVEKARLREAGGIVGWGLEPRSRLELHAYRELLAAAVPPLLRIQPLETLGMLAGVLNGYIRERQEKGAPPGYDGSLYWRPSIAEHGQNPDHRETTHLVSAFREAGEKAVSSRWISIDQLLALARKWPWDVFKRLELHWARVFVAEVHPAALKRLLLDADLFFGGNCDLEYGLLLKEAFGALSPGEEAQVFGWAEQGPRADGLAWMARTLSGEPAPPEMVARRVAHWRVNRLFWIKDALPPAVRARYDQWVAESGEPEHPGFHTWSGGVEVGVRSPLTAEAFNAMSLAQQLDFLRTWEPETPSWNGPMREGLAGTLQAQVKANPVHYLGTADQFISLDPVYASALLLGLREGLKGRSVSNWEPFWTFARWMLQQPDPETEIQDEFTGQVRRGRRWQYSRLEVARLLCAILDGELGSLPLAERASAWQAIEVLLRDPSPAPSDEARRDSGNDPFTLSLNTVRGGAIHAVFAFIRWVRSHSPRESQGGQNLDDVPEARDALESRLDPLLEPTLTVRSVFGANLPRLAFWAHAWLGDHLEQIFPSEGQDDLREVAWTTFIRHSRASSSMLALLRQQYSAAVARMPQNAAVRDRGDDPRVDLGQHLVIYYWWGDLSLEEPDNLLAAFFAGAPEGVRAQVIAFVGRSAAQTTEPIPPEILGRLVRLWHWRVQLAVPANGAGFQDELAAFAWWFDSRKFDEAWSARQMVAALELSRATENQFLWMKRFAEIAERYPAEAVRALELTVQAARDRAGDFWEEDEAAAILAAAAGGHDEAILRSARRAQNLLLGMGRSRFLHALPSPGD